MKNLRYTEIACYLSYVTQAINLNLLPLFFVIFQTDYGISTAKLSITVFLTFFLQIAIDALLAFIGERVNLRLLIILSHVTSAAGLTALAILPGVIDPFCGIIIAVVLYSLGSALLEVVINPIFDRLPKKEGVGFTFAHSFYCWGQMGVILISALVLAISDGKWRFIPIFWAILPTFLAVCCFFLPIPEKGSEDKASDSQNRKNVKLGKGFILFILLMIFAGAAEQGVAQWASYFAEKGLGSSKLLGDLLGPCTFALFMAIGRTLLGVSGSKLNLRKALIICALSSSVCYLAIAFLPSPILSLAACALSGFAVSIMWPASLDLASSAFVCGTTAFSLLSLAGDIGCTVGPSVNGFVSDMLADSAVTKGFAEIMNISCDQAAIRLGFAVTSVFSIAMVITLLKISRTFFSKEHSDSTADGK